VAAPTFRFPLARGGPRPSTIGNGTDPIGRRDGQISVAIGSFDSVSGVTSVTSMFGADDYSLQLNTNLFSTAICSGAGTPAQCVGWQQFVYTNNGCTSGNMQVPCAFMQYWLIGWGSTTCPAGGWIFFNNSGDDECYMSTNAVGVPQQPIAKPQVPPRHRIDGWNGHGTLAHAAERMVLVCLSGVQPDTRHVC
jgi:hypothetical protein